MGLKERKEQEKIIRKNDIIDAAEKLFFEKGIDNTTMDEIAKKVEFSKRTIYVYFQSKEQIYYEIMLRSHKILNSMIEELFRFKKTDVGFEKIIMLGKTFISFSEKHPNYLSAILDYENRSSDFNTEDKTIIECYREGEKSFEYLKSALTEGIEDGSIVKDIDVNSTAIILWSNMIALFNLTSKKELYLLHYHNCNIEQLIKESFGFIRRSLKS